MKTQKLSELRDKICVVISKIMEERAFLTIEQTKGSLSELEKQKLNEIDEILKSILKIYPSQKS